MTSKGEGILPSNYDHVRLKGSLPDEFAVAEVPKHEISSPQDWLFPPVISSRTDSYDLLTGTPDRLTFSLGRVRDRTLRFCIADERCAFEARFFKSLDRVLFVSARETLCDFFGLGACVMPEPEW